MLGSDYIYATFYKLDKYKLGDKSRHDLVVKADNFKAIKNILADKLSKLIIESCTLCRPRYANFQNNIKTNLCTLDFEEL